MKTKLTLILYLVFVIALKTVAQVPNWKWAKSATGNQTDQANAVASDIFGNTIVAGYFSSDSVIFGSAVLYNNQPENDDIFIAKYDDDGNFLWVKSYGGKDNDIGSSLTTDDSGNIYMAAYFYSPTIQVDTFNFKNAGNVGDILLIKYDNSGNIIWAKKEGGPGLEIPYAIKVDNSGNIIVAGRFSSQSVSFGEFTLKQAGSMDVFVVKYNSGGNVLWAKGFGGTSNDEAYALDTDNAGNIYIAGYFNGNINFGTNTLSTSGQADAFITKLSPEGEVIWAEKTGGNNGDRVNGIKVDETGNSYVSGYFQSSSLEIGNTTLRNPYTEGIENSFLAKYDTNGNPLWALAADGMSKLSGLVISGQNVFACGNFKDDTLHFGSSVLNLTGRGDFFILNCDISGNPKWALKQTSGGESNEMVNSISVDKSGNLSIAGAFDSKPLNFGTTQLNTTRNGFDMFVAKFSATATLADNRLNNDDVSVFPNPCKERLTIISNNIFHEIKLFSLTGKLVYFKQKLNEFQNEIDLSFLPSGIYFLRLNDGYNQLNRKIVIEH